MGKEYDDYISSPAWKAKRIDRLILDNDRCVVCKHDGSVYRLEVHHVHYENFGNENVTYDLMTVCSQCHKRLENIRRALVYNARTHEPSLVDVPISARMENQNGLASPSLQVEFVCAPVDAQRADSRAPEQVVARTEKDFLQTRQNRR